MSDQEIENNEENNEENILELVCTLTIVKANTMDKPMDTPIKVPIYSPRSITHEKRYEISISTLLEETNKLVTEFFTRHPDYILLVLDITYMRDLRELDEFIKQQEELAKGEKTVPFH